MTAGSSSTIGDIGRRSPTAFVAVGGLQSTRNPKIAKSLPDPRRRRARTNFQFRGGDQLRQIPSPISLPRLLSRRCRAVFFFSPKDNSARGAAGLQLWPARTQGAPRRKEMLGPFCCSRGGCVPIQRGRGLMCFRWIAKRTSAKGPTGRLDPHDSASQGLHKNAGPAGRDDRPK